MLNTKDDCAASIARILQRTSLWRRAIVGRWPNDPRNMQASKLLDQLALKAIHLTDEQWSELQPYYSWTSETFRNGVNDAARQLGFHLPTDDLGAFVKVLLQILSLSSAVAA
jgi:hypothetical protein